MKKFKIKNSNLKFLYSLLFTLYFLLFIAFPVFGAEQWYLLKGIECIESGNCQLNDILRLVVNVSKLILRWVGVIALIFFIVGGIIWLTSAGNEEKVKRGKKILVNTLIGIFIVFFAWQIVNLIICGLSGGSLAETCQLFGVKKWNVFPGEEEKKVCQNARPCPDLSQANSFWTPTCQKEEVKTLQNSLIKLNCLSSNYSNGCYDEITSKAVRNFCLKNNCQTNGEVDQNLFNKITNPSSSNQPCN